MTTVKNVNQLTPYLKASKLERCLRDTLDRVTSGIYEQQWQLRDINKEVPLEQFEAILARLERRIRRSFAQGLEEMNLYATPTKLDTTKRGYKLPAIKD